MYKRVGGRRVDGFVRLRWKIEMSGMGGTGKGRREERGGRRDEDTKKSEEKRYEKEYESLITVYFY